MSAPRYASVVLDVDSTLCGIEGVDWLAAQLSPALAAEFEMITARAMAGEVPFEDVYAERMTRIRPSAADFAALAVMYRESVAVGALDVLRQLRDAGVQTHLVSGGFRDAILPVSGDLGFAPIEVHAMTVTFDAVGRYVDFDRASPLCTTTGKCDIVQSLHLPDPILAVGDGISDAALRSVVETFVAYTGFVRREPVVALASGECRSFNDLLHLVLP